MKVYLKGKQILQFKTMNLSAQVLIGDLCAVLEVEMRYAIALTTAAAAPANSRELPTPLTEEGVEEEKERS